MAAVEADRVVVALIGDTRQLDAPVDASAKRFDRNMTTIEQSAGRAERAIVRSSGQMANAQRNLGRQISDIGVQLAGGQSPFLIIAQQAPQVADALADMGGRAGRVASFFAGPWGAALLAGASVVAQFIPKLFNLGDAHDAAKEAAKEQAEAEKVLRDVLQGAIDTGEQARITALGIGQAHVYAARAALNEARAQLQLAKARAEAANAGTVGGRAANQGAFYTSQGADERLRRAQIDFVGAEGKLAALERQQKNLEALAETARGIEAQKEKTKSDKSAAAAQRRAEADAKRQAREAERASDQQRQGQAELLRARVELAAAEADLTSDSRLQDQVLRQRIEAERKIAAGEINDREGITPAQRQELLDINDRTAAAKQRKVNLDEIKRYLDEELALQKAGLDAKQDEASAQLDLATSTKRRREISLRLLDLALEQERAELAATLDPRSKATENERAIAQRRLDSLDTVEALRRQAVERDNASPLSRYADQLNLDPDEVSDQVEALVVDELEAVQEGISDAITSRLGVKDPFLKGLLDLFIQQNLIRPLAEAFAGGGGGGGGIFSFLGSFFGRASGGYAAPGSVHRVNEGTGRAELLRMGPQGGEIIPLGQAGAAARPSSVVIQQNFTLDARYGITTPQLIQGVNALVDAKAGQARDQAIAISRGAIPKDIAKANRYGG